MPDTSTAPATAPHGANAPAHSLFLQGCGLPAAWAGAAQWRILETDFGAGLQFLHTWAAWRADPARPAMLHHVAVAASPFDVQALLGAAQHHPDLQPLAQTLAAQAWGLLPGIHRLGFEGGRVLLTLAIGDLRELLRHQHWQADSVVWASPAPEAQDTHAFKALARCCARGARLSAGPMDDEVRGALAQAGFQVQPLPEGVPAHLARLQATFDPPWQPRSRTPEAEGSSPTQAARCAIVGAGLAGAATAASLARRGWQVQVLDAGATAASGASSLPVGVFAPHLSPDDNLFSQVSRAGVRATLEQGARLLVPGTDWQPDGVLERRPAGKPGLPSHWEGGVGADWGHTASAEQLHAAGLPADTPACWHPRAGWLRPARLVEHLLAEPGIGFRPGSQVASLQRVPAAAGPVWQLRDAAGALLAEAELLVLAAGPACNALLEAAGLQPLPLDAVRGLLSWGAQSAGMDLPPFPVNGDGALTSHVPSADGGLAWHAGATFERGCSALPIPPQEQHSAHTTNLAHLQALLPAAAQALAPAFADGAPGLHAWASVRCTTPDRLPIVGPVAPASAPGLWACTGMGARGLTRAVLCGELLAARMHGEPLPVDERLARAMGTERYLHPVAQADTAACA